MYGTNFQFFRFGFNTSVDYMCVTGDFVSLFIFKLGLSAITLVMTRAKSIFFNFFAFCGSILAVVELQLFSIWLRALKIASSP